MSEPMCMACYCCPFETCGQSCHLLDDIHAVEDESATLTAQLAAVTAERDALREALLSDCLTVEGDRDHPCWCDAGSLNHLQDCWQKRAALAARGGESATT